MGLSNIEDKQATPWNIKAQPSIYVTMKLTDVQAKHTTLVLKALPTCVNPKVKSISHSTLTCQYLDVEYSQDVVFDWGDLLLLLNEGTFKLIQ
jgi:hypothetical protein